jgi:ABC-2 type transport system ATP-binding protein
VTSAPDDRGAPAVVVRGLTRRFGPLTAVEDLSFEVERGELFGIVGPDGAGKTTTLRMLAGVLKPDAGSAEVNGVDVVARPEAAKPHLAYMAQRFGMYEDLTVRENLDFYADLYRVPAADRPARLARLYQMSRLGEFEDRLAGKLSGGMKQKLSLSCALVHHPRLLLLDEPTFGVDPLSRRELWLILHEMVAEGITVVVTTSYLDEAERCDRVALLNRGRFIALDRPEVLQKALDGRLLAIRTSDSRRARAALERLPGVRSAVLFGDELHLLADPTLADAELTAALAAAGLDEAELRVQAASLEDVFIQRVAASEAARV